MRSFGLLQQCRRSIGWPNAAIIIAFPALAGALNEQLKAQPPYGAQQAVASRSDSLAQIAAAAAAAKNSRDARVHYQLGVLAASATKGLRDGSIVRDPTLIGIMRIAERALGRATELDPRNAEYAFALAAYYSEAAATGPTERYAARAYRLAREGGDDKGASAAASLLGEVYWRRFDAVAYRRELRGVATVDTDALISQPEAARRFLADYTISYEPPRGSGDLRQAVRHFNDALEEWPANADAYRGLYAALFELSEFDAVLARTAEHATILPGDPWALLARGAALHRLRRESEAGAAFEQGFALMDSAARVGLTRLSRILPRTDSLRYEHLSRARQELTNQQFWRDADILKLTAANEIQTEFYSRLIEAEVRYSDHRFGRSGAASHRGTMWIRYGPPTVRASFPTEMVRSVDLTDGSPSRSSALQGMFLELWYWEEHNLHVVFQGAPGYAVARLYDSYNQVASDARAAAPIAWSNVPIARHPLDTVPLQITRFRAGDSVDVMITARLPLRGLARHGGVEAADIDVGFFVTGSRGNTLVRDSSRARLSPAVEDPMELRSWRTRLPPGTVEYRVEALELSSFRGARASGTLPIVRKRGLATSDLLMADAVTRIPDRTSARWTDYLIAPNTGEIESSKPITLLWETYGLNSRDGVSRYRVHLTISRSGALGQDMLVARVISGVRSVLGRSPSGSDSLSFVFDRTGPALDAFADHLRLDVRDLPEGRYALHLIIEDLVAGTSTRADARELIIRRDR